ncbi:MAG: hypothetical protein HQL31_10155 [Planctomycetes bacterium]|nr:hypothetical protein [Planctomycetota bacterium]
MLESAFIAELTQHIPNHHQKTAYYGRYSNANRGKRKRPRPWRRSGRAEAPRARAAQA